MEQKDNKILHSVLLAAMVLGGLLLMHFIPEMSILGFETKQVDMLADVHESEVGDDADAEADGDEMLAEGEYTEDHPEGVVMIQDFSKGKNSLEGATPHGMDKFYDKLRKMNTLDRPVRIAYYGDSYIEGDIITSHLRAMLQTKFGGRGVGFCDISNPVEHLRISVTARSGGFKSHTVMDKEGCERSKMGIAQKYFVPQGNAWMQMTGVSGKEDMHQEGCDVATIYYRNAGNATVGATVNGGSASVTRNTYGTIAASQVKGNISSVRWSVNGGGTEFFGAAMDGASGVVLDNFSMRGNSGMSINDITDHTLMDFGKARPYDLIVVGYGLNVVSANQTKYDVYGERMEKAVLKLQNAFPDAAILIVGVSDRGTRKNGGIVTMGGVKEMNERQVLIAKNTLSSYWNMYKAVIGLGGIGKMADKKWANKDYTHLTYQGGEQLAKCFFDAIVTGYGNYCKRFKNP